MFPEVEVGMATEAKIGGYNYHQTVVTLRQELREARKVLERLAEMARSEELRAICLQGQIHLYRADDEAEILARFGHERG